MHSWIGGPRKKRSRKDQKQEEPKFRQISRAEELELYKRMNYKPNPNPRPVQVKDDSDNNKTNIDVIVGPGQKQEKEPQQINLVHNQQQRPKVKDLLTDIGIS